MNDVLVAVGAVVPAGGLLGGVELEALAALGAVDDFRDRLGAFALGNLLGVD